MKKEQNKIPEEKEEKKQSGEVSRRDFLVGAGTVVVGGAVGAGLLSSCGDGEEKTITTTIEKTKTVTTTIGEGAPVTVTETEQVGAEGTITVTSTTTKEGGVEPAFEEETTIITSVCPLGMTMEMMAAEVKHNKLIRIRPIHYNQSYTDEEIEGSYWEAEGRDGSIFKRPSKSTPGYLSFPYKKRVYSPNRNLYPLKRVDWEPGGDPAKINTQNRGKSKFKRISWDETASIIASEIKRMHDTYGPYSILAVGEDGHHENKNIHACGGCHTRLFDFTGGYTREVRNPDSWEGWYWGGMHVWGTMAVGMQSPGSTLLDIANNCDMFITIGDQHTTSNSANGCWNKKSLWFKEMGIYNVGIDPFLNWTIAATCDKWIPVIPNTDAAWQLAVIYVWLQEETYDQDYLNTHSIGFDADHMPEGADSKDNFKDYVLGTYDGIPKTPAWASEQTGIPEWTIKALARAWASRRTSTTYGHSGRMRGPYCHETIRIEIIQLAMQGLGRPGVHSCHCRGSLYPVYKNVPSVSSAGRAVNSRTVPQIIPRTLTPNSILNGSSYTWGTTSIGASVTDQYIKYTYPISEEEGGSRIHFMWSEKTCNTSCWNEGFKFIDAVRDSSIECFIAANPWLENDCLFADIVLPISTQFELEDILAGGTNYAVPFMCIQKQAVPRVGDSLSDYEACIEVAKKLEEYGGIYKGLVEKYTKGETIEETIRTGYDNSGITDFVSWEDLNEKGYWIASVSPDWKETKSGLIDFYNDPENNPLQTPSGKLEFYSSRLAETFPDDNERPPSPRYVTGGPESEGWTHDESLLGERATKYPMFVLAVGARWRMHSQLDDIPWYREIPSSKQMGYDGYNYESIWMNTADAEARGIKTGDIVKVYNERGTILCGAYVNERVMEGTTVVSHGARLDIITDRLDRGGSINLITPGNGSSKNCWGQATMGFLVEIEKLGPTEMDQWKRQYPEAFARDYDPWYGLLFGNSRVEGEQ